MSITPFTLWEPFINIETKPTDPIHTQFSRAVFDETSPR